MDNEKPASQTTEGSSEDMGYESNLRIPNDKRIVDTMQRDEKIEATTNGKSSLRKSRFNWKKHIANGETLLVIFTISGVFLGILLGFLVRQANPSDNAKEVIKFPGEILMRGLKMMIIPIITTSIVTGLAKLDIKKSGRIGVHAMIYYIATTTIAVFVGISLVSAIKPGNTKFAGTEGGTLKEVSTLDTYLDLVRNILPANIIAACFELVQTSVSMEPIIAENVTGNETGSNVTEAMKIKRVHELVHTPNILGMIAFFVAFGVTLSSLGEDGKPLTRIFQILNDIFMKMITVIIWYSPVGICFLIASNVIELGSLEEIAQMLGMYVVTVCAGLLIHGVFVLPLIYFIFIRENPFKFAYKCIQPIMTAFGTASSAATLPITIRCLENNIGVDERITRFVLPVGATMNMDGTALLEGVAAITIAQMHGIPLSAGQILTISITATVASIGAAAIPSAGLVTLILVLTSIGIPTESVILLWSIDWFLDRLRTSLNVFGNCVGAAIVYQKNKHLLDEDARGTELKEATNDVISPTCSEEAMRLMEESV